MSHPERPSAKSRNQAAGAKWRIGNGGTVKNFQTISGWIVERDQARHKALVRKLGLLTLHDNAGPLQSCGKRLNCRRVRDLPAVVIHTTGQIAIEHKALLAVIHAESARSAAAIHSFHTKAPCRQCRPIVEFLGAHAEIAECPDFHDVPPLRTTLSPDGSSSEE